MTASELTPPIRGEIRYGFLAVLLIAGASMLLAGFSATRLELLWDEQIDHDIAVGLRDHPLIGEKPVLDASQTRLPMYACSLAYRLTGRNDLAISRFVSLLAGGATIVLTFLLARRLFDERTAILAALLLGTSPYFLAYARIAMTEGDVFFACFTTAAIWLYVRSLQSPDALRWLWAGLALAAAIGAKFFGIFLLPVIAVMATSTDPYASLVRHDRRANRRTMALLVLGMLITVTTIAVSIALSRTTDYAFLVVTLAPIGWACATFLFALVSVCILRQKVLPQSHLARLIWMGVFASLACFVLLPVHMTEPEIALELARRTLRWDHRVPLALWSDHLRLYSGIVLIKQSVPLGLIAAAALLYAAFRERADGRWRPCILSIIYFVVLLCFLPLRQTFYLMGVYPLIMITTAAFITMIGSRLTRWSRTAAIAWAMLLFVIFMHHGRGLIRTFPHYHLYGYETIGDHWLGVESRGYRNLIQTPSDGVTELIRWCETSPLVRSDSRIVSYLWEERIIRTLLPPNPPFSFVSRGLTEESDVIPPLPSLDNADFVLLHINNLLGYGDRPPDCPPLDKLSRDFEVVHVVQRGSLAVGWVYARRDASR